MPPNFLTEGIIIEGRGGKGNGVCIDDPRLISGFFHRTDIKVSDGSIETATKQRDRWKMERGTKTPFSPTTAR